MTTPQDTMRDVMNHISRCIDGKYTVKGVVHLPTWDLLGHWIRLLRRYNENNRLTVEDRIRAAELLAEVQQYVVNNITTL